MLKGLLVAVSIALLNTVSAFAMKVPCAPEYPLRVHYPEVGYSGPASNLAADLISLGATFFHQAHGRWPDSWREIHGTGIMQVDLYDYFMQPIDPDNGTLRTWGDVIYVPAEQGGLPAIITWTSHENTTPLRTDFVEQPKGLKESLQEPTSPLHHIADDQRRINQVTMALLIRRQVMVYKTYKGHYPSSWDEFLLSVLSPVRAVGVSPYNGERIRMDGRPNDFIFEPRKDGVTVFATDENGDPIRIL